MNVPNEIDEIIDRIKIGKYTEADVDILYRLLRSGDRETISQLGKYNVNIKDGKDIHIGDRIYQQWDEKAIEALVKAIQENSGINQNTQGGDAAARDIDKSTTQITNITNIFQCLSPGNEFRHPSPLSLSDLDFEGIPQANIQQAYQKSLPPDAAVWGLEGNNISQKILTLEQFGRLSDFFERLIQDENLPLAVRDRLQAFANQLDIKKPPEIPKNRASPSSGEARSEQLKWLSSL
jgi:hypothetical protein